MPQVKGSINIGRRAWLEVIRILPDKKNREVMVILGCGKCTVDMWRNGVCPSARHLARLYEIGADVVWILTGKRSIKGNRSERNGNTKNKKEEQ